MYNGTYPSLGNNYLRFKMPYDVRRPPVNAQKRMEGRDVIFYWSHNCPLEGQQPSHYRFTVHDTVLDTTNTVDVKELWHRFYNISYGGVYNFSISSAVEGAIAVWWLHKAPPLPTPTNLRILPSMNESFSFEWQPVKFSDSP